MSKCIPSIIQSEKKVDKVLVLFKSSKKADNVKIKIDFWVEQCMQALFECPEYVNEIIKTHTKAVSGEFYMISLFLQKWILGVA